jgi:hypothetical protein
VEHFGLTMGTGANVSRGKGVGAFAGAATGVVESGVEIRGPPGLTAP